MSKRNLKWLDIQTILVLATIISMLIALDWVFG